MKLGRYFESLIRLIVLNFYCASLLGLCEALLEAQNMPKRSEQDASPKPEGAKRPSSLTGLALRGTKGLARQVWMYNIARDCTKGQGYRSRSNGSGSAKWFLLY